MAIKWAIFFAAIFGVLYGTRSWHAYWVPFLVALVIVAVPVILIIRLNVRGKRRLNQLIEQDLKGGHKKVIARRIEKQDVSSARGPQLQGPLSTGGEVIIRYLMVIDGVFYSSHQHLFESTKEGDLIYFHVAPNTAIMLGFTTEGDERPYPPARPQA
ncbi:MAG TPA: hypothetical protein VD861_05455 [Pyrinomonadaceae bacterium]|nr:hypothetical protein [Pyrinomonadaceae bacterium]